MSDCERNCFRSVREKTGGRKQKKEKKRHLTATVPTDGRPELECKGQANKASPRIMFTLTVAGSFWMCVCVYVCLRHLDAR